VERERLRRTLNAAEEERRRWARELHDETLQGLGGLRVLLSSARRSNDLATLQGAVSSAIDQLAHEIANLRSLITELRPAALDQLGLGAALEALLDRVRASTGLEIVARVELAHETGHHEARLDPEIETTVYRVVQESLTNAGRHAGAERIDVRVLQRDGELRILIRDDGRGFDPTAPGSGFGLTGMRERAALVGGRLEIASDTTGTTVCAVIPTALRSAARPERRGSAPQTV
jgi:signal transduction histidine kinase